MPWADIVMKSLSRLDGMAGGAGAQDAPAAQYQGGSFIRRSVAVALARGRYGADGLAKTARAMAGAEACLVPEGDTPTSARLYNALAAGCAPATWLIPVSKS